jgi:Peptidase family S41
MAPTEDGPSDLSELIRDASRAVERHCALLESKAPSQRAPVPPVPAEPVQPHSASRYQANQGAAMSLAEFRETVTELTLEDRAILVDAALDMIEQAYVHLPLKRAMHACDPVQRLKLLKLRLAEKSERGFHDEMISIFHSLRDLHTNYILPASYRGKVAYLPFLIEEYFAPDSTEPRYLVAKARPVPRDTAFGADVHVTHWNGIPIRRAIELNAEREAGSNHDARFARGLEALTLRPMWYTAPPDEDWVIVTYRDQQTNQEREVRLEWQVFEPPPSPTGIDWATATFDLAAVLGLDARTEAIRRARKALFAPHLIDSEQTMASAAVSHGLNIATPGTPPIGQVAAADSKTEAIRRSKKALFYHEAKQMQRQMQGAVSDAAGRETTGGPAVPNNASLMPDVFSFKMVTRASRQFGYIRIYTFNVSDANAFVSEFIRIAELLPKTGLILDVRGNGGGNILAGERLLQVLTPNSIEPERFHFINSPLTLELCKTADDAFGLKRWADSIEEAIETGETYSRGYPLEPPEEYNRIGQQYQGPVVLIVDALCYSTTDIFAAGFQDHDIGKILGVQGHTGAGGANVWDYALLTQVLPTRFKTLPKGAGLRVAIRKTTRVNERAGISLEDLGVQPDKPYHMSHDDILGANEELIAAAAALFDDQRLYLLSGAIDRSQPPLVRLEVQASNVTRVDVYRDDRPLASTDVQVPEFTIGLPDWTPPAGVLQLRGYDQDKLVAVKRIDLSVAESGAL